MKNKKDPGCCASGCCEESNGCCWEMRGRNLILPSYYLNSSRGGHKQGVLFSHTITLPYLSSLML